MRKFNPLLKIERGKVKLQEMLNLKIIREEIDQNLKQIPQYDRFSNFLDRNLEKKLFAYHRDQFCKNEESKNKGIRKYISRHVQISAL